VSETTGLALAMYDLRRVAQTRRTFANWPVLLRDMAGEKVGRGAAQLEFVTRSGVRITTPNVPGARLPLYEQFADDCYRLRELLAPLSGAPLQVFDIGAHIGSFATNLATLHPQARVECFEPSAQSAAYLRRNVEQNGLAERVTVHQAALSDHEGTALFDDNDGGSVHNGLMREDGRLVDGADALTRRHAVEVPTTTFDNAVAAAPAPPQVVKMDCEGGEYALVYASSPQSWAHVQVVVMEYHPVDGESWEKLSAWFRDVGLDVVAHRSEKPGLGTAWLVRRDAPGFAPLSETRTDHPRTHPVNDTLRSPVYRVRRLTQTPRAFSNWGEVLRDMALGKLGHGPESLTFRTRSGACIDTPNRPGARVPVYELFAEDSYRLSWLLGPLLQRPIQVLDVGGHVGTFSVRLTQLHKTARVTAFEPSATTADYLRRNVQRNGVADRVTVVQRALAATSGHAIFDDNGAGSGLNGLLATRTGGGTGVGTDVETISFDEAVASAGAPVDLVKIDCEGGEYALVLNSSAKSWSSVRRVVIEHHPVPGHSWPQLRAFFASVGLEEQEQDFVGQHGCVWLSREPLPAFAR
jgi:FkbM family methyltransferase